MSLKIRIIDIEEHRRGKVYKIKADGKAVSLLLTFHALQRIKSWTLSERQVLRALLEPQEVLKGHRNRYIAHYRTRKHVVRVIYEYDDEEPVVVTVYYPFAARYFKGGGIYEDKILA
jgi:mRNA-degrading endonuclease RelE of RelBE toxin-antitoxin system